MKTDKALLGFFAVCGTASGIFAVVCLRCYVLSKMWAWYFVPFFHQQQMPLAYAFGIALTASMITSSRNKKEKVSWYESIATGMMINIFSLCLGAIGTVFLP